MRRRSWTFASLLHYSHDVFFAHYQKFVAVNFDGLTSVFAEENFVADFDVWRVLLAAVVALARAYGQHFALIRLFGGGVRDHDAGGGLTLFFKTLNDYTVVQGAKFQ